MEQIRNDIIYFLKSQSFMDSDTQFAENESLTKAGIIDSIGLLELLDHISERYSIEIPEDMLTPDNLDSLQGITNLIVKLKTERS
ncbi:acyl carrier protein [Methanolobus halotolerans]|uniref:Acyl carrier protein n=2 Tax=Methanolobus halotolerans TaxID=2052935 RepID=A0A4E0Q8M8_9EURY|nr:acyl carrier protein [Methanolobus halotolerans]